MEAKPEISSAILAMIREGSAAGRLVRTPDILTRLQERGLVVSAGRGEYLSLDALIAQTVQKNDDLREAPSPDGVSAYYSLQSMTETYAGLLAGKAEAPPAQIARVVRDHSKRYPRPIRADSFSLPPFAFSQETISVSLEMLEKDNVYQDIRQTTTSAGTLFLFSCYHLDPEYASLLAEWLDVGRVDNP